MRSGRGKGVSVVGEDLRWSMSFSQPSRLFGLAQPPLIDCCDSTRGNRTRTRLVISNTVQLNYLIGLGESWDGMAAALHTTKKIKERARLAEFLTGMVMVDTATEIFLIPPGNRGGRSNNALKVGHNAPCTHFIRRRDNF